MRPMFAGICVLLWLVLQGCGGRSGSGVIVSAEESNRLNPIAATPASISEGRDFYLKSDCLMCHGVNAKLSDAPPAAGPNCDAWTDTTSLKNYTDGELAYVINRGKGNMLGYQRKLGQDQVWKIVDYIHACGK